MKKFAQIASLIAAGAFLVSNSLAQAEALNCSQIGEPGERLACYDLQFPSEPRTEQTPEVTQVDNAPVTTDKGDSFDNPEQITVESVVTAIKDEPQKKMVFSLENGQIWLQNSPQNLPIQSGDKVTIKSASIGGYLLRNESGTSTRVRRIK